MQIFSSIFLSLSGGLLRLFFLIFFCHITEMTFISKERLPYVPPIPGDWHVSFVRFFFSAKR